MDCYFHSNVPSVAPCKECGKPICATCRDDRGDCPSCRLAQKIDAATATRQPIGGHVGSRTYAGQQQQQYQQQAYQPQPPPPTVTVTRAVAVHAGDDPIESRGLIALGYPLWPLALLGLLDRKQSAYLRRQTYQAIGFGLGMSIFSSLLAFVSTTPLLGTMLGYPAWILAALCFPVYLVASCIYGFKVWMGEDVRIPILTDWIDEKLPINS